MSIIGDEAAIVSFWNEYADAFDADPLGARVLLRFTDVILCGVSYSIACSLAAGACHSDEQ